jgi:arabinofuranosyltransferase
MGDQPSMPHSDASVSRMGVLQIASALLLGVAAALMVWRVAWVTEDSFITFRYVANTLAGHGAVFNVGEFTQGYTHPLWFALLLVGGSFLPDLILLSFGLGLFLTVATQLSMARSLTLIGGNPLLGVLAAALFALVCVSSNSWLSFQTGGLENALSHLLLVILIGEIFLHELERPFAISVLGSLLVLNRPDFAFTILPFAVALLPRLRESRSRRAIALGALPLAIWIVFAFFYYGDIAPNTARAKVGILPTWWDAISQGGVYLGDWIRHEPIPAFGAGLALTYATLRARSVAQIALAAGIWLQMGYVILVGGDFMRGRFLLSVFVAGLAFGLCRLVADIREREAPGWLLSIPLALVLVALPFAPDPEAAGNLQIPQSGIVDERLFYPGYRIDYYLERGRIHNPYLPLSLADELRAYAEACGPVTVHARNPGTLGYLAGPEVTVIDPLGLTDAFVARLPKERLISKRPRIGHPDKSIPLAYLAKRGDIAILKGWPQAVAQRECDFLALPSRYVDSEEDWLPGAFYPPNPEG